MSPAQTEAIAGCPYLQDHPRIDQKLLDHDRRLDKHDKDVAELHGRVTTVQTTVARLEGRLAVWAALGAVGGGAVASIIARLVVR